MAQSPFKQGIYRPVNRSKFLGTSAPVYRSSFELKFMKWADLNPNVLKWGAENVVVPYVSPVDGRVHRYFVDNIVLIKEGSNVTKYLIEIKPSSQIVPPVVTKRKRKTTIIYEQVTYAVNCAKWDAARDFAKKHGMKFQLITEKELPS